uniref:DUF1566 domain-containing protein n=1 Tax=Desulfatirhabdium butyrativorans TaxID=340467 RepID=A0A7C4VR67_9BACT
MSFRSAFFCATVLTVLLHSICVYAFTPPDTGQTKCYDNVGNQITCPQPGQDYYGQDANFLINPNAFVKMDADGKDLPSNASSWAMVRDNATGLVWEVKNNADGTKDYTNHHDADNIYTWYDPNPLTNGGSSGTKNDGKDTYSLITALNQAGFGGYSDWRIPSREELRTIVDYSRFGPAINTAFFPNTQASPSTSYYWSSTTHANNPGSAWIVYFYDGGDGNFLKSSYYYYVRAVRGGQ